MGCFRSGTTLTENIIRTHPDVASIGFETSFYSHIAQGRPLPDFNAAKWRPYTQKHVGVDDWTCLRAGAHDAFDRIMAAVTAQQGGVRWVEKTPNHLFYIDHIKEHYPAAQFVYVLRDGRDVVTSWMATPYLSPRIRGRSRRLLAASVYWERTACVGTRLLSDSRYRKSVLLVRYEDLVERPEAMTAAIRRFMNLRDDPSVRRAQASGLATLSTNSAFDEGEGVLEGGVGRWRQPAHLPPSQAQLLDYLLHPTLSRCGYRTSCEQWPGPMRRRELDARKAVHGVARLARTAGHGYRCPDAGGRSFISCAILRRTGSFSRGTGDAG